MKKVIYYFSGTGNSLKVAKDVAEKINNIEIIKICIDNMDIDSSSYNKVGFIFTVYASGMPPFYHSNLWKSCRCIYFTIRRAAG